MFIRCTCLEDIQPPILPFADETQDGAHVISKYNLHEEAAVDETCSLENLLVLHQSGFTVEFIRISKVSLLIELQNSVCDILQDGVSLRAAQTPNYSRCDFWTIEQAVRKLREA